MKIILLIIIGLVLIAGLMFYLNQYSKNNCPVIDSTDRFNGSRHLYGGKMVLDINNANINTEIKNNPSYRWSNLLNKWCIA
jgi:hypothetical protein